MPDPRAFGDHDEAKGGTGPFAPEAEHERPPSGVVFPDLALPASMGKLTLGVASNGLNYVLEFEVPIVRATEILRAKDAITLYWEGQGDEERLLGMGAALNGGSIKRDPDDEGAAHLVVKYKLSQDQVLVGIGVVAYAMANDLTLGVLHVRSDQAVFDYAAKA